MGVFSCTKSKLRPERAKDNAGEIESGKASANCNGASIPGSTFF